MNVAILVKEFPPDVIGGTETQTLRMARELQEQTAHEVTVYTKRYPSDPPDVPFDLVGVPNWRRSPFLSTFTFVLAATFMLVRDADEFDVLQCMMVYPNGFVGWLVNRFQGLPYFAWIRGGDYYFMKDTPGKRWAISKVLADTLVLVQTERVASDVRDEFSDSNLDVLGNGVDIPEQTADGDEIVFVGRLKDQKGVHVLIQALEDLDEKLLIVGDGPERERLERLASRLDVEIEFVGEVNPEAVEEYLHRGKAFVLPSVRGEGLPNAVLEAMAIGLPVVVTGTGGVADAVVDGETGFIVEPGNEEGLRDRLELLCEADTRRERMGVSARKWVVENHSWNTIISDLDAVYRGIRRE
ncbi:glycosyltransferase family 4 protein [Salinibaculum rarum]|uniref:glycosyltransferase family 4 protein n=1 Tax=Salinibaculum rarum TaxID=3058903 RepID=UPI00265E4829|nr:glycosyltransferase family 4 protein [Salinibaculum sp. KK48]